MEQRNFLFDPILVWLPTDKAADALDTTSAGTDGGRGDTLDVVSQDLSMALSSSLVESFSSFSSSRHFDLSYWVVKIMLECLLECYYLFISASIFNDTSVN